jgi:anti-sigma regulatory factor (Ser/Thr protein kinase)
MPAEPLWRLDLCVTEALANVIAHGGAGTTRIRSVCAWTCAARGGGEACGDRLQHGRGFDPLTVQPRPRPRTLAEAEPGGHGLAMLRQFADALDYSYSEGRTT